MFIIVFLEYMNLPGLPAGIIMPAAGILIASHGMNFGMALIVSVIAGLLGSYVLYFLGFFLVIPYLKNFIKNIKNYDLLLIKPSVILKNTENKGVFLARLIPVARTLISLTVGTVRMNFVSLVFILSLELRFGT